MTNGMITWSATWRQENLERRCLKEISGSSNAGQVLSVLHRAVYHKNSVGYPQRVVRQEDRKRILSGVHEDAGHYGARRTLTEIMRMYWYPTMSQDVSDYVEACETYQSHGRNVRPTGARSWLVLELFDVIHGIYWVYSRRSAIFGI